MALALCSPVTAAKAQERGASLSQAHIIGKGVARSFASHHPEETDELVAHEAGVETEEDRKERPGSNSVQKPRLGKEDQDQNPKGRHREFRAGEKQGAMRHNSIHEGIDLDHAEVDQLQCQEGVSARQKHRSHGQEKEPRVMPVQKHDIVVSHAPMRVAAGTRKPVKNRSPGKIATIRFCTFNADCTADLH